MSHKSKRNPSNNFPEHLYICDPSKNTRCFARFKEGWCMCECFCTKKYWCAEDSTHPLTIGEYEEEREIRRGNNNGNSA